MNSAAGNALFWPMTNGMLPAPENGARVLYVNARAAKGLPPAPANNWIMLQFFKPWADALAGYGIRTEWPDGPFDYVFVHGTKQAEETKGLLAEGLLRLKDGGWITAAGENDEGGKRLAKDLSALGIDSEAASKFHARVAWGRKAAAFSADTAHSWRARAALQIHPATAMMTCPGLFSWDRVDKGSALLASCLPPSLPGQGADFGCGQGYLARALINHSGIAGVTCLDADARAVAACAHNMKDAPFTVECRQADLTRENTGLAPLDWIVMNPPFHEGRMTASSIGVAFIRSAATALKPKGQLYMVANDDLPYENVLQDSFDNVQKLRDEGGYKVFRATAKRS